MNDQPNQPSLDSGGDQNQPIEPVHQTEPSQPTINQPLDFTESKPSPELSEPFSWQATEGVNRERPMIWYVVFIVIMLGLMAVSIFLLKNITFAILIPVMTVASFILMKKDPRVVNYTISPKGVYVGDKLHDFSEFRSFGLVLDMEQPHVMLFPTKRFAMGVTLHFDEEQGEKIVDLLGARIPMQEVKLDLFEKFIRWAKL